MKHLHDGDINKLSLIDGGLYGAREGARLMKRNFKQVKLGQLSFFPIRPHIVQTCTFVFMWHFCDARVLIFKVLNVFFSTDIWHIVGFVSAEQACELRCQTYQGTFTFCSFWSKYSTRHLSLVDFMSLHLHFFFAWFPCSDQSPKIDLFTLCQSPWWSGT